MSWVLRSRGLTFIIVVWILASSAGGDETPWGYLFEIANRRIHALRADSVSIGRLAEADVVLRDPRVSRRHAEINRTGDEIVLLDSGSTNGTRRNGERVLPGQRIPLGEGDLLMFGYEKLLFHRSQAGLWDAALQHTFLAGFLRLRVPVLSDREVHSLGRDRVVHSISYATVDDVAGTVQMDYPDDAVHELEFRVGEPAFVGQIGLAEGEVRLSLWGLAQEGSLVSRRASMSKLKHGELRVRLAADTPRGGRARLEGEWSSSGVYFLFPLLDTVVEALPEDETVAVALKLIRGLMEQNGSLALRDAVRTTVILQKHFPDDAEIPVVSAQAGARWVKRKMEELRGSASEQERSELVSVLTTSKSMLETAQGRDADKKVLKSVEAELAEAEAILAGKQ